MSRKARSPIGRFLKKIKVSPSHFYNNSPCWEWDAFKSPQNGYGQFVIDGRRNSRKLGGPHTFAYEYFVGPIPPSHEIDHLCNNRACCSPLHLEPVTHSENQKRAYERGRKASGGRPYRQSIGSK